MLRILFTSAAPIAFMSEQCETVVVKGKDGSPVRINKSDYDADPKAYGSLAGKADQEAGAVPHAEVNTFVAPTEPQIPASAPIMGDRHPLGNTTETAPGPEGDGERRVLLSEPVAPVGQNDQRQVAKIGSKHFVVDSTGNKVEADGIDPAGYKSEGEAWKAANPAVA